MEGFMGFIINNIAYILLAVSVLYFAFLIYSMVRAKKSGEPVQVRFKYFLPFAIILGLSIYCLVTGTDLKTFIR